MQRNGRCELDKRLHQTEACHRKITQARGGKGAGTRTAKGAAYAAATIVKTKEFFLSQWIQERPLEGSFDD
jgi:hypothetical protein